MKQTICITLLFSILLCLFSGCAASGAGSTSPQQTATAPTEAPTTAPTEAPTTAPTEAPTTAPTEAPTEEATTAPTEASSPVSYTIDIPYAFSSRRGVAGWEEMTKKEQLAVCQIPDETVKQMTTPALLETLFAYPRWQEMHDQLTLSSVFPQMLLASKVRNYNAGKELQERADLKEWIAKLDYTKFSVRSTMTAEDISEAEYCYNAIIEFLPYYDDTVYNYPITPDSPEWATMTEAEKIAACQIPEDLLARMSTDALNTTLANYPLLADAAAKITQKEKLREEFLRLLPTCNGYEERGNRSKLNLLCSASFMDKQAAYAKRYWNTAGDVLNLQTGVDTPYWSKYLG